MYDTYADDIFRYLYVHLRDVQTAEDLTADTFTKAWAGIDKFDFKQPRPWLYRIARNLLTDHWRKKKPVELEEPDEVASDTNIEEDIDREMSRASVLAAVGNLKEPMKSVVTMRFLLNYSASKTADALGLTEANVRVIQFRALKKLKGILS